MGDRRPADPTARHLGTSGWMQPYRRSGDPPGSSSPLPSPGAEGAGRAPLGCLFRPLGRGVPPSATSRSRNTDPGPPRPPACAFLMLSPWPPLPGKWLIPLRADARSGAANPALEWEGRGWAGRGPRAPDAAPMEVRVRPGPRLGSRPWRCVSSPGRGSTLATPRISGLALWPRPGHAHTYCTPALSHAPDTPIQRSSVSGHAPVTPHGGERCAWPARHYT